MRFLFAALPERRIAGEFSTMLFQHFFTLLFNTTFPPHFHARNTALKNGRLFVQGEKFLTFGGKMLIHRGLWRRNL